MDVPIFPAWVINETSSIGLSGLTECGWQGALCRKRDRRAERDLEQPN